MNAIGRKQKDWRVAAFQKLGLAALLALGVTLLSLASGGPAPTYADTCNNGATNINNPACNPRCTTGVPISENNPGSCNPLCIGCSQQGVVNPPASPTGATTTTMTTTTTTTAAAAPICNNGATNINNPACNPRCTTGVPISANNPGSCNPLCIGCSQQGVVNPPPSPTGATTTTTTSGTTATGSLPSGTSSTLHSHWLWWWR